MSLIRALIGQSRLDEAEATVRELMRKSNNSTRKSSAYTLLAQVYEAREDFDQALAELDRAEGYKASGQITVVRERIVRARDAAGGRGAALRPMVYEKPTRPLPACDPPTAAPVPAARQRGARSPRRRNVR